ncbi:AAA family ATPase [Paenibacillus sp. LMG 31456]|uniref:AAA family ATPase n=1 Tax=Paenibacillus foliorum TaxID=2654974 RepID=A0A972GN84_9BACL|nr:AAA family ATPase [Paenibacillus foliorum]NOU93814.1 AAA family ATPase [Paenibacillus foliorum]
MYDHEPFIIYRGSNPATQEVCWIKMLNTEYPSQQEVQWITAEYENSRQLHLDDMIKPLRLESYNETFHLYMEYSAGKPLSHLLTSGQLEIKIFLRLAISCAAVLLKLHHSKNIHLNLTSHAFIVDSENLKVQITDFNDLLHIPADNSYVYEPKMYPDSRLPYMAPEQTGRMNRQVDFRTDIYSIGIVFYEMLTGRLPFLSQDVSELIHHHMAKEPAAPSDLPYNVPKPISDIVMKCLAKQPESRYQSVFELRRDLETCQERLLQAGHLDFDNMADSYAVSDTFRISEALYGRKSELEELQEAYKRSLLGNNQMVLISGMSGIGKSYLIHEFQQSIQLENVLFISGKFEQYSRDTPFQAINEAGQQLTQYVLTRPEDEFVVWKNKLEHAVSPNGQVLVDMIPDMEKILGKQPPLPKLPPDEIHNRFLHTLLHFLEVFAVKEQPLIIFIDDLQWSDNSSLQLIQDLAALSYSPYLLFIGAYREKEITDAHPLRWTIDKLDRMPNIHVTHLHLRLLNINEIKQMLQDSLQPNSKQGLEELASLVMQKTKGNPFFTKQFLHSLYDQQLLEFNYENSQWQWNIHQLKEFGHIADNVIELMIHRIRRLPPPAQSLLMHASCIGRMFSFELLTLISSMSVEQMEAYLTTAIHEGLVVPLEKTESDYKTASYKFLHDRVHQAVYSLVSKEQKQELHYRIGKQMLQSVNSEEQSDQLFVMTNHLNLGKELLTLTREKELLIDLNIQASKKAKANTAYETALKYVTHSLQLLDKNSWICQYESSYTVYAELAELEYLCGHFEAAKRSFQRILNQARTQLEKADVYNLMIVLYTNLGMHELAMNIGLEGLRLFGITIHPKANKALIMWEMAKTKWNMGSKKPEELFNLPPMTDLVQCAVMKLMVNLIPPTYYLNSNLYVYLMLKMFNYSLRNGNSEGSALSYSTYGVITSSIMGNLDGGVRYGEVGLRLSDANDRLPIKSKVYFGHGAFSSNIKQHIKTHIDYLKQAHSFGVEAGDFVYAGYSIAFSFFLRLFKGDPLSAVYEETNTYHPFVLRSQDKDTIYILMAMQRFILFLMNKDNLSPNTLSVNKSCLFINPEELEQLQSFSNKSPIHTYYALQLMTCFLLDNLEEARGIMEAAEENLQTVFGLIHVHLHYFMSSLVMTALYSTASKAEQRLYDKKLNSYLKFFKKWSDHSPENFLHLKMLMEAEINRIYGNHLLAAEQYEQAIFYANKHNFIQYEAIAYECAAKFYMQTGKLKITKTYLLEAKTLYSQWGAVRKVTHLEEKHPYLINRSVSDQAIIDASTMAKASHALSNEAVFLKLLESFMSIVIENAGAEKGLLLLMREQSLYIEVEKIPGQSFRALHSIPLDAYNQAAITTIQYAIRMEQPVLLHDAALSEMFGKDEYIQRCRPKSLLILPIMKLGKMIGLLYLENNLASHVFQEQRLDTVKLLTAEIAGTIENAKLYSNLEYKDYKLQLLEEQEKNIRLQLDEKERWVQSSEATMLNIRKSQHELINNVQTVHALLMMNKYDMAKDYISVWCKEIVQQSVVNSIKFPVLGVVLNNISLSCISNKIDLQVSGHLECSFERLTLPISYFSSIMNNLLKNAVEAVPQEDLLRTVRLTIEEHDQTYKLSVFNSGSIIEEQHCSHIFDKGFSTKPETTNSGLGLHIAQNYLLHYGGSIECNSVEGSGTTFTVHFMKK